MRSIFFLFSLLFSLPSLLELESQVVVVLDDLLVLLHDSLHVVFQVDVFFLPRFDFLNCQLDAVVAVPLRRLFLLLRLPLASLNQVKQRARY